MKRSMVSKRQIDRCRKCSAFDTCFVWGRDSSIERLMDHKRRIQGELAALRVCLAAEAKAKGGE